MTLPPLPSRFFSTLGPLTVRALSKKGREKMCGKFSFVKRRVYVSKKMAIEAQWMTFWHEIAHAALADSGANNKITDEQQAELICDMLGQYLTAAMQAGWITLHEPNEESLNGRQV